jgi:hypothetical protein
LSLGIEVESNVGALGHGVTDTMVRCSPAKAVAQGAYVDVNLAVGRRRARHSIEAVTSNQHATVAWYPSLFNARYGWASL